MNVACAKVCLLGFRHLSGLRCSLCDNVRVEVRTELVSGSTISSTHTHVIFQVTWKWGFFPISM
jgi:hypothetical protein